MARPAAASLRGSRSVLSGLNRLDAHHVPSARLLLTPSLPRSTPALGGEGPARPGPRRVVPLASPDGGGFWAKVKDSIEDAVAPAASPGDGKAKGTAPQPAAPAPEAAPPSEEKASRRRNNRAWRSRTGRARSGKPWIPRGEQLALEEEKDDDGTLAAADRWRIQERVNSGADSTVDEDFEFQSNVLPFITSPNAVELSPQGPTSVDIQPAGTRRRPPLHDDGKFKPEATGREVLLQAFNWESHKHGWYKVLGDQAQEIKDAGFTLAWLPPASQSVSNEGYMPGDYYDLNSKYGSVDQLKECLSKLHQAGLGTLADIVINHRCAQRQDEHGIWNLYGGKMDWDQRAIVGNDPNFRGRGNKGTGSIFHAAPNIDHTQEFVRNDIKTYMNWLKEEIGFDGWRFDFTKGYGGEFVGEYVEHTYPLFSVGEFWDTLSYSGNYLDHDQDGHRQRTVDWINATGGKSLAFDMTTKGILHAVLENNEYWRLADSDGRPPGVLGFWPSRTCTFIENHDTGSTQGHWRFPDSGVEQGYAYILTHPGTPCVFWDHYKAKHWQPAIKSLLKIRRENDINCRSQVHILKADSGVYAAQIDDRVIVKIGPRDWGPNDKSWEVAGYGHQWCVWSLDKPSRDIMDTILEPSKPEAVNPMEKFLSRPAIMHDD